MHDGHSLPAKLSSRCILEGYARIDGHVRRHPIIDMISSKFEARALECDHDLLVWRDLCGDSIGDGDSRKIFGTRVNHHRFDFFPYVEFVRAITPIDVLHLEMSEGGGSLKHRRHLFAFSQPTDCDEQIQEEGPSHRESLR